MPHFISLSTFIISITSLSTLLLNAIPVVVTLSQCRTTCNNIPINYPFGIDDGCGSPSYRKMLNCSATDLFFITPSGNYKVQSIDYAKKTLTIYDPAMSTCSILQPHHDFVMSDIQSVIIPPSPDTVFALLNCSIDSPILNHYKSLCFNFSGHSCDELYGGCTSFRLFHMVANSTMPPCCFTGYDTVKYMSMNILDCTHYTSLYNIDNLKGVAPVDWVYGMKLSYSLPETGCERCAKSGGTCGFDVETQRMLCLCSGSSNSTRECDKDYNRSPQLLSDSKEKLNSLLGRPAADRHYKKLLNKTDLFSSSLWKTVRQGSTSANDKLLDNMSYKIPSSSDARKGAKALLEKAPVGPKSVDTVAVTTSGPSNKRQKVDDLERGFRTLKVADSVNVFMDPSSINDHVEALATEEEEKFLQDLGASRIIDDAVTSSYRMLLEMLALRRSNKYQLDRIKGLKNKVADIKKEKDAVVEEMNALKEKASQVDKLELDVQELTKELGLVATKCMVKARGEVMLEYQSKQTSRWVVQEDIDLYRAHFPLDYEDMIKQLKPEEPVDTREGSMQSHDKEKSAEDDLD